MRGAIISAAPPRAAVATPGHNVMASEDIGRMVCLMASLPDGTNLYEGTAVPLGMAFLARG